MDIGLGQNMTATRESSMHDGQGSEVGVAYESGIEEDAIVSEKDDITISELEDGIVEGPMQPEKPICNSFAIEKSLFSRLCIDMAFQGTSYGCYLDQYARRPHVSCKNVEIYSGRPDREKESTREHGKVQSEETLVLKNDARQPWWGKRLPKLRKSVKPPCETKSRTPPSPEPSKFIEHGTFRISENGLLIEFPNQHKIWSYIRFMYRHKDMVDPKALKNDTVRPGDISRGFGHYHKELIKYEMERWSLLSRK